MSKLVEYLRMANLEAQDDIDDLETEQDKGTDLVNRLRNAPPSERPATLLEEAARHIESLYFEMSRLDGELDVIKSSLRRKKKQVDQLEEKCAKLNDALHAERERCAKIAENIWYPNEGKMIAKAIREGK